VTLPDWRVGLRLTQATVSGDAEARRERPALLPEGEVLLLCARRSLEGEGAERLVRLLREGVDWTLVMRQARWHGVRPMLCMNGQGLPAPRARGGHGAAARGLPPCGNA
jgi:hypothetical protein